MKPLFWLVMVIFGARLPAQAEPGPPPLRDPRAGEVVHGDFLGVSAHAGAPGVLGGAVMLGRSTTTLGTMGMSWAGASIGANGGKERYAYALFDAGFIGILGGKAGIGAYRESDSETGIQAEAALGIMVGLAYTRLRYDPAGKEAHFELGVMTILPVIER